MAQSDRARCLIVGAGGTGSEIAKILSNKQSSITVLDYDAIEISNLNRQFYYTENDRSKYKSKTISDKIGCKYEIKRIEDVENTFLNDFDATFSCLDSVSSRMELNYKFINSNCPLLIDCGVEGLEFHVKRVSIGDPCLYCMKDLYNVENTPFICSLGNINDQVTPENRQKILNSLVFKTRERPIPTKSTVVTDPRLQASAQAKIVKKIVFLFNKNAPDDLKTSIFEVQGIYNQIIPNICTINSICASYAVDMALNAKSYDFIHFSGSNENFMQKIRLKKNTDCFVCK